MFPASPVRRQSVMPYITAVLAVLAASFLILKVPPLVERGAFIVYLAVVALVTWFGGWRAGLVTIALTLFAIAWFILAPRDSIKIDLPEDWLRLGVYLVVALMITALHASRERARDYAWQTEQRLAFALKCANMGAWHSNLKTGQFWWSPEMEKLFGRAPGEFSGTYDGFIGYIHPDDQDFVKRAVTVSVDGGTEFEIEHRVVRPDGEVRWLLTKGKMIKDESGETVHLVGVVADVTQRRNSAKPDEPAKA